MGAWQSEHLFDTTVRCGVDWPASSVRSVALLAEVAGRWFAVTFGHGRHLLRQDLLVADFGLRVTANTISPDRVRSLMSLLLDAPSRTTSQRLSVPGTMGDFSVDLEGEWVRSLGGLSDDHVSRGMTGSQSLRIDLAAPGPDLAQLHELLKYLLANYEDTRLPGALRFIDLVVPLHRGDRRVERLDAALAALLVRGDRTIGLIEPRPQPGDPIPDAYRLRVPRARRRRVSTCSAFATQSARRATRCTCGSRASTRTASTSDRPISCVNASSPRWFWMTNATCSRRGGGSCVDPARLAELDRELAAIPELLSERLDMPMWVRADSEGDYNATTAEIRGWQLMDKELFYGDDPRRDRIEICDLLTERMDMVCVK